MKRKVDIFKYQHILLMCLLAVSAIFLSACKDDEEVGLKAGEGKVVFQISKKNLYAISSLSEIVAVKPILLFEDQTIELPSLSLDGNDDVIESEAYVLKIGMYKVKSYKAADKDGNWIADLILEDNNTFEVLEGSSPVYFNVSAGIRVNLSKTFMKNSLLGICNEIWPNDKDQWIWKEEDDLEDWKNLEWETEEGTGALISLTGIVFNRSFYEMEMLPEPVCNLSSLEGITIIGDSVENGVTIKNKLKHLPKKLAKTNIKVLTIINCDFDEFPEFLTDCDLNSLSIIDCNIKSIPESISKMENLRVLHLSNNKLTTIPASISKLKRLQSLDLANNPITSIPSDAFEGCTALQEIILSGTDISALPNMPLISKPNFELGDVIGRGLYLDGCKFTSVPTSALVCPAIRLISLKNNQITSVNLNADQMKIIDNLYLDGNKLTSLNITSPILQALTLSNTGLQSVPTGVSAEKLLVLDLKDNSIQSVPESYFSKYPVISQVNLSNNQLTTLPTELGFTLGEKGTKSLTYLGLNKIPQLTWQVPSTWVNSFLYTDRGIEKPQLSSPARYVAIEAYGGNGVTK